MGHFCRRMATEMQGGGERSRVQVAASGLAPIQPVKGFGVAAVARATCARELLHSRHAGRFGGVAHTGTAAPRAYRAPMHRVALLLVRHDLARK